MKPILPVCAALCLGAAGQTWGQQPAVPAAKTIEPSATVIQSTTTPSYVDEEARTGGVFASVGFNFLRPRIDNNTAFNVRGGGGNFDWNNEFAPEISLGYDFGNGRGIRGKYREFDQSTALQRINPAGASAITSPSVFGLSLASPGPLAQGKLPASPPVITPGLSTFPGVGADFLTFRNSLNLSVFDIEAFRDFREEGSGVLLSGGARYASISQSYRANRSNAGTGAPNPAQRIVVREDSATLIADQEFDGWGPTAAAEGWYRIGSSNFSLHGGMRGSALFGERHQDAALATRVTATRPTGPAGVADVRTFRSAGDSNSEQVYVIELNAGVEYGRTIGRSQIFVNAGIVYERWLNAGSATSPDGDIQFYGFKFGTGFRF